MTRTTKIEKIIDSSYRLYKKILNKEIKYKDRFRMKTLLLYKKPFQNESRKIRTSPEISTTG